MLMNHYSLFNNKFALSVKNKNKWALENGVGENYCPNLCHYHLSMSECLRENWNGVVSVLLEVGEYIKAVFHNGESSHCNSIIIIKFRLNRLVSLKVYLSYKLLKL